MSAFEWFSVVQTAVMVIATVLVWSLKRTARTAVHDHDLTNRLTASEQEIARLREWRHNMIVPWQQGLLLQIEERFVTRREWDQARNDDSPWPQNRRKGPRP